MEIPSGTIPLLGLWTIKPRQRVRLLVNYEELWRPILWMEAGEDGSVYLSTPLSAAARVKAGTGLTESGKSRIEYAAGEPVPPEAIRGGRVSFHSSGRIHMGDVRLEGKPFRDGIDEPWLLSYMVFEHPSSKEPRRGVRLRDITSDFPIDDRRPLQGRAVIRPWFNPGDAFLDGKARDQRHFVFNVSGTTVPSGLAVHLMFMTNVEGPWPPGTHFVAREASPAHD